MADLPATTLRDTFFIWFYTTVTSFSEIEDGTLSPADLLKQLETNNHITPGDANNASTVNALHAAVKANPDEFSTVNDILKKVPVLIAPWTGGNPHPLLPELDSVFIPPRNV